MGKGKGKKKESILNTGLARSLREEGKGVLNVSSSTNANIIKKMQHLQRLAVWAAGEGGIPPIGALLGVHLASMGEVSGIPPLDSSFFTCERCETILQPGINCSVRVLNHPQKARHKPRAFSKFVNVVVYSCNFCSHKNMKPGTHKEYLKKKTLEMPTVAMQKKSPKKIFFKQTERNYDKSSISGSTPSLGNSPGTLMLTNLTSTTKKRKQKDLSTPKGLVSSNQRPPSSGNSPSTSISANLPSTAKKRKRKGLSTLKELASSNQRPSPSFNNLNALKIPSFNL